MKRVAHGEPKFNPLKFSGLNLAPVAGFGPATKGLTVLCATTAPHRSKDLSKAFIAEKRVNFTLSSLKLSMIDLR